MKTGSLNTPILFFKMAFSILGSLLFHTFYNQIVSYYRKLAETWFDFVWNLYINFRGTDILAIWSLSVHDNDFSYYLFKSSWSVEVLACILLSLFLNSLCFSTLNNFLKKTVDTLKKVITFYFIIMSFNFLLNSLISSVNYTVDFWWYYM